MLNKKEIQSIINYIIKAGEIAFNEQQKINIETKPDSTIVTNGDLKVSKFLEKKLSQFFPVLSEENYNQELLKDNKTFFLIDPIDGTISYSKKQDTWTSITTLVHKNKAILAIVYQPTKNKLFIAEQNKGVKRIIKDNITNMKVKAKNEIIIASPNYKTEDIEIIKNYNSKKLIKEFGAALKIMNIIENKADHYTVTKRWFGVWDLIGPALMIKEAGGSFHFLDDYKFDLKEPKILASFIASSEKDVYKIIKKKV